MSDYLDAASRLSPRAARIALQTLLTADVSRVPTEWCEASAIALYARAAPVSDLTPDDWLTVASASRPSVNWIASRAESTEQVNARLWFIGIRLEAERHRVSHL
ncbi:hypothetical protein J2W24_005493 [Variovorax boronicumulans]|uniref:hypothetical protein n=1 Tax=Variovorax boronicumulans TaxID=436515 RepID=UPI0027882EE3|nr:hypothetical protein [Variovorax boronicumulans]MDP9919813.1 hypothetical protein [Variovorax boronicumulans]